MLLEICKYFKIDPPLFSIFATSNILTSHTNFHSIVFSNSFMAKKITDTIENKKTVFVIYLDKDTYSKDLTALLDKYFFKKSIENIKYLKIKEDLDIYKKIGKIIEKDVIIIPIFSSIKDYDVLDYYVSKLEKKINATFILPDGFFVSPDRIDKYKILEKAYWFTYIDLSFKNYNTDFITESELKIIKNGIDLIINTDFKKIKKKFLLEKVFFYKFENNKIISTKILH